MTKVLGDVGFGFAIVLPFFLGVLLFLVFGVVSIVTGNYTYVGISIASGIVVFLVLTADVTYEGCREGCREEPKLDYAQHPLTDEYHIIVATQE